MGMKAPWKAEDSGKRWSRDEPDLHLTCRECPGLLSDFGPSWLASAQAYPAPGEELIWRSAPFPPTSPGLQSSMAWCEDTAARLKKILAAEKDCPKAAVNLPSTCLGNT